MSDKNGKVELNGADPALLADPEESAEAAGLRYVSDQEPGVRRKRWGRGFTYLTPSGEHIQDPERRARFESLAIPPAWSDVWICIEPDGHIQVTGRDDRGRKQYIYHPRWEEIRNLAKFNRLLAFGAALPAIRAQVDEDLRRRKMSRAKVIAIAVALLDETLIRIGNRSYARENNSFGLTTLRKRHVELGTSTIHLEFRGKSGKQQAIDVRDRRLARQVRRCHELPGQELFKYVDAEGQRQPIDSGDVNAYLREVTGESFSAKDFRTWGGSVHMIRSLESIGPAESEREADAAIREGVKAVAERLGNTRAICRDYYIHPVIMGAYRAGTLLDTLAQHRRGDPASEDAPEDDYLAPAEVTLLEVLRSELELET